MIENFSELEDMVSLEYLKLREVSEYLEASGRERLKAYGNINTRLGMVGSCQELVDETDWFEFVEEDQGQVVQEVDRLVQKLARIERAKEEVEQSAWIGEVLEAMQKDCEGEEPSSCYINGFINGLKAQRMYGFGRLSHKDEVFLYKQGEVKNTFYK